MNIRAYAAFKILSRIFLALMVIAIFSSCQRKNIDRKTNRTAQNKAIEHRVAAIEQYLRLTAEQPVNYRLLQTLFLKDIKPLAKAASRFDSEDLSRRIEESLNAASEGIDPYSNLQLARIGTLKLSMLLMTEDLNHIIDSPAEAQQSSDRAGIYLRSLSPLFEEALDFSGQQDLNPRDLEAFLAAIDYPALASSTVELAGKVRIVETAAVRAFAICTLKELKFFDSEKNSDPESARIRLIKAKAYYSVISDWFSRKNGSNDILIRMTLKEKMGKLDYPSIKQLLAKELPQLALKFKTD